MHRRIAYLVIIISILLLTGCDVSIDYWKARAAHLLATPTEQRTPVPTLPPDPTKIVMILKPSATPTPAFTATSTLPSEPFFEKSKIVNGMEITLNNVRRDGKWLRADICFPVLDGEDWMLNHISFRNKAFETRDHHGLVIDPIIPAKDGKPGRRCDMVGFDVGETVDLSEFTITVYSIYAPPREGGTCARAEIVTRALAEQGIKVACVEREGFEGYQILEKPDSISETEANQRIRDAMWYVIKGPWEFNARLR